MIAGFAVAQHALPFQPCILVISSGAEGAVEKSLDFIGPVTHQDQDPPSLGSVDLSGQLSSVATTSSAGILERSHRERRDNVRNK